MITAAVIILYLLVAWLLAPRFARWAKNDGLDDPGLFGLFGAALWPFIGGLAVLGWVISLLARITESRAKFDD